MRPTPRILVCRALPFDPVVKIRCVVPDAPGLDLDRDLIENHTTEISEK